MSWSTCSYVLPSLSCDVFDRVVVLMIYIRCIFSARRREIVLLPTPLGPTRTMSVPGAFALFAIMTPGEADILVCQLKVGQTFLSVASLRAGAFLPSERTRIFGS